MLRFAVIGAGRIASVHAAGIAACTDARLVLVTDPNDEAAERLAGAYGARAATRTSDVYEDDEVDAVVIASPTPHHAEQIMAAVDAGKAVFAEKPIALDVATVDACLAVVGNRADRVMVGFNRRFDPSFAEIRRRVAAGEVGRLEQLTIISRDPTPPSASYAAQSGGIFRDMTIHDFDMARFMLGEIVEVFAVGQRLDGVQVGADDFGAAVVTLVGQSGAVATIVNSRHCAAGYDQRLEGFGPRGSLVADNHTGTSVRFNGAAVSGAAGPYLDFFLQRYADSYRLELAHFVESVASGVAPSPGLVDGREALVLADAATASAASGEPVSIRPVART